MMSKYEALKQCQDAKQKKKKTKLSSKFREELHGKKSILKQGNGEGLNAAWKTKFK